MISLPVCRWRGEAHQGRYVCQSPKFLGAPNLVMEDYCARCTYVDHAPPMPVQPVLPCVHLGAPRITTDPTVFACALHGSCVPARSGLKRPNGPPSCNQCPDYLPRDPFGPNSAEMLSRAEEFLASTPDYPADRFHGCGVVIAGGGERYFPSLYVTVRALRHVGCRLPIQVWYLGRAGEMPPDRQALLAPYNIDCIDADAVRCHHPARRLDGWELKVFATLHSSFEELLFLDADCYPCRNPEFLFELEDYRAAGVIFWPDWKTFDERLKWAAFGVSDPRRPGSVESGQFVVNKRQCWRALNLAWFYNDHSDYYYRYCYGDKHTFEVAWTRLGQPLFMFTPSARVDRVGYLHIGPDCKMLFIHRCSDKFRLDPQQYMTMQRNLMPRFHATLPLETECWSWLKELAQIVGMPVQAWDGAVLQPVRTPAARITLATLHTPEIAAYGALTTRVLCQYAARHGYRTLTHAATLDPNRPPSWSKIPLITRAFAADPPCEWLMWVDADAMILRHEIPLTEFLDDAADFIVADDFPNGPLNAGVFFARNCLTVVELLHRAYAKTHLINHPWWEQAAIVETLREGVAGLRVKIVPRQLFNSYAGDYRAEDFLVHFTGQSHGERTKAIRRGAAPILFPMPNHFRPGTNDREIFDQVVDQNEYQLDDDMHGAIVLDVGGHIGIFAYACCVRGAAEIWSVEAHPENFPILEHNLAEMPLPGLRVPIFGAAWRSDTPGTPLRIHDGDGVNRGGRWLTKGEGADTTLIPFDEIVRRVTRNGTRRIDLLKLDCEAAEFPILYTSRTLGSVGNICAEIHPWMAHPAEFQVRGFENNQEGVRRHLESQGFRVTIHGNHLWAQRLVSVPADR